MPAVLIYNQKNLEYIVLPNRQIFGTNKDLVEPITAAERHPLWKSPEHRKRLQREGERFFKTHEEKLGTSLNMNTDGDKMSPGFFLYLTFCRFQNQQYQASIIPMSELSNVLGKKNLQKSDDTLVKLLTLETALEYLVKANPQEEIEYIDNENQLPKDTRLVRTERGAIGYFPSEIGQHHPERTEEDVGGELEPEAERAIGGVQAPELDADDDDDDDDEGQGIIGEKIDAQSFIDKMKGQGFRPLDDLIKTLPRISKDQQDELIRQSALAGKGPQTAAAPITPHIAVVNEDGKVTQITTADGQLQSVQEFDPENPGRGGKQHLFFGTDANAKIQVAWMDGLGRQHAGYSAEYTKGQAVKKFDKIKELHKVIPQIEKQCKADIISNSKNKEAALTIALIHNTYRRVGSGRSKVVWDGKEGRPGPTKDKEGDFIRDYVDTFGVTSFQAQHLIVEGKKVYLNFLGKSGKLNYVEVTDPLVKKELIARKKAAGKNQTAVIMNIKPPAVNAYLKQAADDDFSVKNFRTYHASRLAADLIAKTKIPKLDREKFDGFMKRRVTAGKIKDAAQWKEEAFLWALKERNKLKLDIIGDPISAQLSNTKQVCIAQYIDPQLFTKWDISLDGDAEGLLKSRPPAVTKLKVAVKAAKIKEAAKLKNPSKPKAKGKGKTKGKGKGKKT